MRTRTEGHWVTGLGNNDGLSPKWVKLPIDGRPQMGNSATGTVAWTPYSHVVDSEARATLAHQGCSTGGIRLPHRRVTSVVTVVFTTLTEAGQPLTSCAEIRRRG
jgi:hypothetical protein